MERENNNIKRKEEKGDSEPSRTNESEIEKLMKRSI